MSALTCLFSLGLTCTADITPTTLLSSLMAAPATSTKSQARPKATDVLVKVKNFYDATKDLRGAFTQTYTNRVYGTTSVRNGTLSLRRPKQMVWDYKDAADPDVWVENDVLWMVEHDTKQAIQQNIAKSDFAGAIDFLFGGSRILSDFHVRHAPAGIAKKFGMKGHHTLELRPKKKNAHYKRLVLVVRKADGQVDSFVVRNGDDSINQFVFTGLKRNGGLKAQELRFKLPDGYSVIRE